MQITRIKKKVVAASAGLAIAGSVAASAASLGGLASDSLGADAGEVGACDTDGIDVEYTNSFDTTSGEYVVDTVTLSDIAFECLLRPYEVSIFKEGEDAQRVDDGLPLVFVLGRKTLTLAENFPAEDLEGVAMYIGGEQVFP